LHPTRPEIATGDIEGRVYIWHTLYNKLGPKLKHAKAKPFHSLSSSSSNGNTNYNSSNSSMHLLKRKMFRSEIKRWHAHGVSCLSFTPDGHYLLSGGEEAVLQRGLSNSPIPGHAPKFQRNLQAHTPDRFQKSAD
jgi:WD40 repeat protein